MKQINSLGLVSLSFIFTACTGEDYLSPDLQTFDLKGDVLFVYNECILVDQQTNEYFDLYSQEMLFDKENHRLQLISFANGSSHNMAPCNPKSFYDFEQWDGKKCYHDNSDQLQSAEIGNETFTWFHSRSGELDSIRIKMDFGERVIRFGKNKESYSMYGMSGYSTLDRTFSEVEYDEHGNWIKRMSVNTINEVEYGIMDETRHYCFEEFRCIVYCSDTCNIEENYGQSFRSFSSNYHHFESDGKKAFLDGKPVRVKVKNNMIQLDIIGYSGPYRGGIIVPSFEGQLYCQDSYLIGTTKDGEMIGMKNDSDFNGWDDVEEEEDIFANTYSESDDTPTSSGSDLTVSSQHVTFYSTNDVWRYLSAHRFVADNGQEFTFNSGCIYNNGECISRSVQVDVINDQGATLNFTSHLISGKFKLGVMVLDGSHFVFDPDSKIAYYER